MGYPKHIVLEGVTYEARDQAHEDALRASVAPVYMEKAPINAVEALEPAPEPAPEPKPKARKGKSY
jgi:hypothetical protein